MKSFADLSYRTKLLLFFGGLIVGLVAASVAGSLSGAESTARTKSVADFKIGSRALLDAIARRSDGFRDQVTASLADPIFRSQLSRAAQSDSDFGLGSENKQSSALRDAHEVLASADLPLLSRYPILVVVNREGRLIFSRGDPARVGEDLSPLPVV
ncbi:MAG TPA: hypothetical protein VL588_08770, partial [Bdellovibrionota bacterium]|nr:hypothetical protein [Bdellovibrionota bacterium]